VHYTNSLSFRTEFKNFGPVPAQNTIISWKVYVGGVQQETTGIPKDHPSTMFPSQVRFLSGHIGDADYPLLMNGTKTLRMEERIDYDGPHGHTTECSEEEFSPTYNGFLNLGSGCK